MTTSWPRLSVAGTTLTALRQPDLLGLLEEAVTGDGPPITVETVNLSILRQMHTDPGLRSIINSFTHRVADGWPLLTLARRTGRPLPERVTGADFTPAALALSAKRGWRVALVGGSTVTRERLAVLARERWGLEFVGHWLPEVSSSDEINPSLATEIRSSGAQILLVALGCPKQERWIATHLAVCGVRFAIGIGGSLDFLAGTQVRAPLWIQKFRCEWLFRCLSQPRRLAGRYVQDALFFAGTLLMRPQR